MIKRPSSRGDLQASYATRTSLTHSSSEPLRPARARSSQRALSGDPLGVLPHWSVLPQAIRVRRTFRYLHLDAGCSSISLISLSFFVVDIVSTSLSRTLAGELCTCHSFDLSDHHPRATLFRSNLGQLAPTLINPYSTTHFANMALTQEMAFMDILKTADVEVIEQETVSIDDEEIRPEDIPLPRDSMITVRLSDAQLLSESPSEEVPEVQTPTTVEHEFATRTVSPASRCSSRASSQSSRVSTTSNSVDWEGLEKSEEQEIKDEATDEVRNPSRYREPADNGSPLLCFLPDSNRKTMP